MFPNRKAMNEETVTVAMNLYRSLKERGGGKGRKGERQRRLEI